MACCIVFSSSVECWISGNKSELNSYKLYMSIDLFLSLLLLLFLVPPPLLRSISTFSLRTTFLPSNSPLIRCAQRNTSANRIDKGNRATYPHHRAHNLFSFIGIFVFDVFPHPFSVLLNLPRYIFSKTSICYSSSVISTCSAHCCSINGRHGVGGLSIFHFDSSFHV